jgi:hypothetical protein
MSKKGVLSGLGGWIKAALGKESILGGTTLFEWPNFFVVETYKSTE